MSEKSINGLKSFTLRGLWRTLLSGAKMGMVTALFYGLAFTLVAVPRASIQIFASLSLEEGLLPTLLANAANIFLLAIEFAFGLGLIAALLCALTMGLTHVLVLLLRASTPRARLWIGLATSLVLAILLHILLWPVEGILHAMLFRSIGAYLFWLGAPCLIFIALTAWVSSKSFPRLERTE